MRCSSETAVCRHDVDARNKSGHDAESVDQSPDPPLLRPLLRADRKEVSTKPADRTRRRRRSMRFPDYDETTFSSRGHRRRAVWPEPQRPSRRARLHARDIRTADGIVAFRHAAGDALEIRGFCVLPLRSRRRTHTKIVLPVRGTGLRRSQSADAGWHVHRLWRSLSEAIRAAAGYAVRAPDPQNPPGVRDRTRGRNERDGGPMRDRHGFAGF